MFEIKETDKGIELDLSNSEEHTRTGVALRSSTYRFTFDEWLDFTKAVVTLGDKMYPKAEPEPEPEVIEEPEEELKGQADLIYELVEAKGPLTYPEIAKALGVSPKRASNIVSTMIRDGVDLKREGKPRKVSLD